MATRWLRVASVLASPSQSQQHAQMKHRQHLRVYNSREDFTSKYKHVSRATIHLRMYLRMLLLSSTSASICALSVAQYGFCA